MRRHLAATEHVPVCTLPSLSFLRLGCQTLKHASKQTVWTVSTAAPAANAMQLLMSNVDLMEVIHCTMSIVD